MFSYDLCSSTLSLNKRCRTPSIQCLQQTSTTDISKQADTSGKHYYLNSLLFKFGKSAKVSMRFSV